MAQVLAVRRNAELNLEAKRQERMMLARQINALKLESSSGLVDNARSEVQTLVASPLDTLLSFPRVPGNLTSSPPSLMPPSPGSIDRVDP